jgi:hypothetical protein
MEFLKTIEEVYSLPVRILFLLVLLIVPFLAGLSGASPLYILAIFPIFVIADIFGAWRESFSGKPASALLCYLPKALIVQGIIVGLITLLGRGVGSLSGWPQTLPFGEAINWPLIGVYAGASIVLGFILLVMERGKSTYADKLNEVMEKGTFLLNQIEQGGLGLPARGKHVTIETLFNDYHYTHYDQTHDKRVLNKDKTRSDEAKINREEDRLGIQLPALLRKIYLKQNGGSIQGVSSGDAQAPREDDPLPFSGNEDLNPLEMLRSLHESIAEYAYEDQADMFPKDAKNMIVLSEYYREVLFLDYRDGRDTPRVGFFDFDLWEDLQDAGWEDEAVFWPDFDAFFASLYRLKQQ